MQTCEIKSKGPGAEATIDAMEEWERLEIGRKTYRFVRRLMQDPEIKARIQTRAEELRAASLSAAGGRESEGAACAAVEIPRAEASKEFRVPQTGQSLQG